jgi:hypothetical protein
MNYLIFDLYITLPKKMPAGNQKPRFMSRALVEGVNNLQ